MSDKSDVIIKSVQDFYNEAGVHFSRTRQKTYGSGTHNWVVTDRYLKQLKPGSSVLDLGCGNGKLVTGLPSDVTYIGTDFSETLLEEARSLHPTYEFQYGDVLAESDWDKLTTYDAIFCVAVLHHIPTREKQLFVLKQIKNHLKPGGFVYLTVWNLWQERFLQYHQDEHVEVPYTQNFPDSRREWKRYCVAYELPDMLDIASEAGLTVSEIFYADREGRKADVQTGENLVLLAKIQKSQGE